MKDIAFRDYVAADFEPLLALWCRSVAEMPMGDAPRPGADFVRETLHRVIARSEVTVAWRGGEMAGFLAVTPQAGVLDQLFLDPAVFRQGLGQALFARAVARMPGGFTLYTPAANTPARAFYARMGMVETREDVHPVMGHPVVYLAWRPER